MSDLKQNIIDLQSILSTVDDMGSTTEVNVLPKEIMKDKISYGPSGKIVGVAPFSLVKSGMSELPFTDNWVSAAWGNNTFVVIAQNSNAVAYSTEGTSWNSTTLPKIADWRKVIFGNGVFVAIAYGENMVAYSTNGITWNSSKIGTTDNWITAAFGNGNFVVVA